MSDLSKETTEGDLWNLDDELHEEPRRQPTPPPTAPKPKQDAGEPPAEPGTAAPPQPRGKSPAQDYQAPLLSRSERPVPADEIGDLDEPGEAEKVLVDDVPASLKMREAAKPLPVEVPAEPPVKPEPEAPAARPRESKPRAGDIPPAPAIARPRLNRREVLSLASFAFVLLVVALWFLSHFFSQLSFKSDFVEKPDFPVKGEHVALAAAETFWREPIREGEGRDVARREVVIIPVLELSLDPEASPRGALRVIFRNGLGQPVGDPITRSFTAGRFDASGNAKISFPATDGFLEDGEFNAYRTGHGDPWIAEVLEGPSVEAPSGSFKKLAPIPVLPLRR